LIAFVTAAVLLLNGGTGAFGGTMFEAVCSWWLALAGMLFSIVKPTIDARSASSEVAALSFGNPNLVLAR
jgi:hypothetical protein